jgi:hypothetical protein
MRRKTTIQAIALHHDDILHIAHSAGIADENAAEEACAPQ